MSSQILTMLGGLGLFLLGMVVMTEGLRGLAGAALHEWLARFTHSPASGAVTGTIATAVLQSSSATTVTAVGFVAAGLMTFSQALGIVFGANLGTTITGWMVALLGFKFKIGAAALPVIFAGAMLRLFGRGRWMELGRAVAGFGVIFLGIGFTQEGMDAVTATLTPDEFPPDTWAGRFALVGLGVVITMITRSSSAGVAMTLTALSAGAIHFPQAAALVIGMDVGTTVTAVIASIGASASARRTGWSHTIFNVFSAGGALLLLDAYVWSLNRFATGAIAESPELALVGFHTLFNAAALVVVLPLAGPFARLMEMLVPERGDSLTRRLDHRLLQEPRAATAALEATLRDVCAYELDLLGARLIRDQRPEIAERPELEHDLRAIRDFLDRLNGGGVKGRYEPRIGQSIHALDHLYRLSFRLSQEDRIAVLLEDEVMKPDLVQFRALCAEIRSSLDSGFDETTLARCAEFASRLRAEAEPLRDRAIEAAVAHDISVSETGQRMAAHRWLERVSHHVWRMAVHLAGAGRRDEALRP